MKKNLRNSVIQKGNKKIIQGWVMYDWSNSVYQLTIASAIFPIYYNQVTRQGSDDFMVSFFGYEIINTVLYSWAIASAYLVVAMFTPLLSSLADYTGRRKSFMQYFTYLGAVSCGALFFFDAQHIELGIIAFALATIGYGGSIVYYNSFLPVIVDAKDMDRISARGYSMGYLGGVVLLLFNLFMILKPSVFGITDGWLPAKISFVTVFLWWIGFSQITFRRLPRYTHRKRRKDKDKSLLWGGYLELVKVFQNVRESRRLSFYLTGFFFVMMGLLTVMFMAATYGEKEMGLKDNVLIPTILLIQLVGMAGAWFFSRLSGKIGNLKALMISVIVWILICLGAYLITNSIQFMIAAFFIGVVMGGTQSLSRSTYSKMLPASTTDHTSYFSFYDVMEKLATVAGTFSFGIIEALTGSMRYSVLAIAVFFILGIVFLSLTMKEEFRMKRSGLLLMPSN